jgi:hypothetical protein
LQKIEANGRPPPTTKIGKKKTSKIENINQETKKEFVHTFRFLNEF